MERTALIIGASGLVGGFCLQYLLRSPHYRQIIVLGRKPLSDELVSSLGLSGGKEKKLIQKIIDFDRLADFESDIEGQDVYCCIGTTFLKSPNPKEYNKIDFIYPDEIAKMAKKKGAERFALVSALTANPKGLFFYSRVKGKLEEAIKSYHFKTTIILRPSYLMGERKEFRPIEKLGVMVLKILSPVLMGPLRKMRPVEAKKVARVLVDLCVEGKPGVSLLQSEEITSFSE